MVLRATEALLALRFPGFSRFERSQDESVMDLVLGGVLEASWSDVGRLLGGQDGAQDAPKTPQDAPRGPQDRPNTPQEAAMTRQDAAKTPPRGFQERPRRP